MARCKKLRRKWYVKNFLKRWWVNSDSKRFNREYDARTFSEHGFSLKLDSLMHGGREWVTLHSVAICVVMLAVAKTAVEIERADLIRCVRYFNG